MFLRVLLENQVHFQLDTTFHANNNSDLCVWGLCCFTLANPRPDDRTTSWKLLEPVDPWACGTATHLSFRAPSWNILPRAICSCQLSVTLEKTLLCWMCITQVLLGFGFWGFFFFKWQKCGRISDDTSYNKEMRLLWWFHYLLWF